MKTSLILAIVYLLGAPFLGALLEGLDLLILNMLRPRPHPTHLSLGRALVYAARVAAKRTLLTHLSHDYAHAQLLPHLPPAVAPAHDGLALSL